MKGPEAEAVVAANEGAAKPAHARRLVLALRLAAFLLVGAAALFTGGFGLFANNVGRGSTAQDIQKGGGIIVLTGGQARIDAAVDLLKSGKGKRLLISGVHPAAGREDIRRATGGDKKLFSCCVDIDHAALDTIGNAAESAKWVEDHDYESVILVTNNYHIPRSLLEMSRYLPGAVLTPYPVVNTRLDGGGWMTKPEAVRGLFTEYTKYLAALARGVLPAHQPELDMVSTAAAGAR